MRAETDALLVGANVEDLNIKDLQNLVLITENEDISQFTET